MMTLKQKLLSLGGVAVAGYGTEGIKDAYGSIILERGRLAEPVNVEYKAGKPNQCHLNTSLEYLAGYPAYRVVAGFALATEEPDGDIAGGVWVRHSWLQTRNSRIVETIPSWKLYFGVVLNKEETTHFVLEELYPYLMKETTPFVLEEICPYLMKVFPLIRKTAARAAQGRLRPAPQPGRLPRPVRRGARRR
jgi:hypothetical protein